MRTRVLIVDDDHAFQRTAAEALAGRGYDIVGSVGTLADARRAVGELRPDAVLLDINLPDGSGLTFAEELDGSRPDLRVLVTSSDAASGTGRADFVAKTDLIVTDLTPYLG